MHSFIPSYLKKLVMHPSTTWLISQCTEARGKQELWQQTRPEILKSLQESAIIQSSESSNRIEGVQVEQKRLVPLIFGKAKPNDRPEEEIIGYKKALAYIHKNYASIKISSQTIKKLHALAQKGSVSDAGKFKIRDNEIIEILPNGERTIRFKATKAADTEKAIEQLCLGYQDIINKSYPDILVISNFVFDFLCIHPFRDGNGRVSRLLTMLLLMQNGYFIGKYISIERIIEENKDDYYRLLKESSDGWHLEKHDLMPWWNYFFSIIKEAYKELNLRVEQYQGPDNKSGLIRQIILQTANSFQLSDITKLTPNISQQLIKKVLAELKKEGKVQSHGRGAGSYWKVL
jgi:Fic family protein